MGQIRDILCTVIVFTILVFGSVFEENIHHTIEAQLFGSIATNEGTFGSSADGKYFENGIQTNFSVVNGILNNGVLQEGTELSADQGEIRFGTNSQWDFLHTPVGSNVMSINLWIKGDLVDEADSSQDYAILSTMNPFDCEYTCTKSGFFFYANEEVLHLTIFENGVDIERGENLNVPAPPNDGQWHMVTLAIDHGTDQDNPPYVPAIHACLDGICQQEFRDNLFVGGGGTAETTLTIGSQSSSISNDFTESSFEVDDVTIWHGYNLTSSDITALYNGGVGSSAGATGSNIAPSFQVLYVTFDDIGASTPDTDGDGVYNEVDTLPDTTSDDFSDIPLGGTSSGTITTRGNQILTITEEPNPAGVRINADISGGLLPTTVNACGGISLITLNAGDEIVVTCGSVTIDVTSGPVDITFISSGGTQATTTLTAGNSITFDQDNFSFVAPSTNVDPVVVIVEGEQIILNPGQTVSVLSSNKDSFIKQGELNTNEGANAMMKVRDSGNNRALISFDQNEILAAAQGRTISSATLRLYIEENGNNWGPDGRTIDIHRLLADWTEGNGFNDKPESMTLSQFNDLKTRGDGLGVTWKCATDIEINNQQTNCNPEWNGATFNLTPTDTITIFKDNPPTGTIKTVGWIEFDVTSDLETFLSNTEQNYGWVVKKTEEGDPGLVEFTSDESATNIPELVLVFN